MESAALRRDACAKRVPHPARRGVGRSGAKNYWFRRRGGGRATSPLLPGPLPRQFPKPAGGARSPPERDGPGPDKALARCPAGSRRGPLLRVHIRVPWPGSDLGCPIHRPSANVTRSPACQTCCARQRPSAQATLGVGVPYPRLAVHRCRLARGMERCCGRFRRVA